MSTPGGPARYGLVGWPLEASLSPMLHDAAFRAAGINATYSLLPTPPERLAAKIQALATGDLAGLNVTVPHKVRVIDLLDALADTARLVGAVNTVQVVGGRLVGHDTDVAGFRLLWSQLAVPPGRVVVLGAGGAARAAVSVLLGECRTVTVVARDPADASALAAEMAGRDRTAHAAVGQSPSTAGAAAQVGAAAWTEGALARALADATAVVNATPLADSIPRSMALPPFVADLVAWPVPTGLEARARAVGCAAMGGIVMLVGQAAEAFALWTGLEPPVETMRRAAVDAGVLGADAWPASG